MIKFMWSTLAFLAANAAGLFLATILLPGFTTGFMGFWFAVIILSLVQALLGPLIIKISLKSMPELMGGISLVTIFLGLLITSLLITGMDMGGIANWLAATLLVWIGSLVANFLLPIYVFKQLREDSKERDEKVTNEVDKATQAAEQAAAAAERAARAAEQANRPKPLE